MRGRQKAAFYKICLGVPGKGFLFSIRVRIVDLIARAIYYILGAVNFPLHYRNYVISLAFNFGGCFGFVFSLDGGS